MLTAVLCLTSLLLGLIVGWYARLIRDLLTIWVRSVEKQRAQLHEKRNDQSGVVQGSTIRQRGRIVDIPPFDESNLVRSPSPADIKKERQRAHEQDLMRL